MGNNDTDIMQSTPEKLTRQKGVQYPEAAQEIKTGMIRATMKANQRMRNMYPTKANIDNVEEVRERAEAYEDVCAEVGVLPSFIGLCSVLGCSRQWLYKYSNNNPKSETVAYLDRLRHDWASMRAQMGELRLTSEAFGIFLLKNAHLDLQDKVEIEATQTGGPMDNLDAEAARARIMAAIPDDPDDE